MNHRTDHNQRTLTLHLEDAAATERLGEALARALLPAMKIHLRGEIGSGKTTLVRALLRSAGVAGPIKSPSFALVELYAVSRLELYHFDFYRFTDPAEWRDAGLEEYFAGPGVCLVEWPERAGAGLPRADVEVSLEFAPGGRCARLVAHSTAGERCLKSASAARSTGGSS